MSTALPTSEVPMEIDPSSFQIIPPERRQELYSEAGSAISELQQKAPDRLLTAIQIEDHEHMAYIFSGTVKKIPQVGAIQMTYGQDLIEKDRQDGISDKSAYVRFKGDRASTAFLLAEMIVREVITNQARHEFAMLEQQAKIEAGQIVYDPLGPDDYLVQIFADMDIGLGKYGNNDNTNGYDLSLQIAIYIDELDKQLRLEKVIHPDSAPLRDSVQWISISSTHRDRDDIDRLRKNTTVVVPENTEFDFDVICDKQNFPGRIRNTIADARGSVRVGAGM